MSYAQAIEKAWSRVSALTTEKRFSVPFMSDAYSINLADRQIMSDSCNTPAKDYTSIILLHYLIKKLTYGTLPPPSGEWIDFNQLEGGEGYYPAFKKRTIDHVVKKYGADPDSLLKLTERMNAKKSDVNDVGLIVYPFGEIGILITMSKADEEFGPDANILFDKNISKIFCTEDIVVLTEIVVHQL